MFIILTLVVANLTQKSIKYVFLGYSPHQKGYKCYSPTSRKFYHNIDVTFENQPYYSKVRFQRENTLILNKTAEFQYLDFGMIETAFEIAPVKPVNYEPPEPVNSTPTEPDNPPPAKPENPTKSSQLVLETTHGESIAQEAGQKVYATLWSGSNKLVMVAIYFTQDSVI